jgi:hypothetical protein
MIALASRLPSDLWFRPAHNRNRADAVLWAAFDDPVAVGHIDQHVALLVEEAHDLKRLEDEAALRSASFSISLINSIGSWPNS